MNAEIISSTIQEIISSTIHLEYDVAGNMTKVSDANGTIVDITHDDDGRVIHRAVNRGPGVLGTTAEDFVWDAAGRLVEARNDSSTIQYGYDSFDRVLSETQGANPIGQTGKVVNYAYDVTGNVSGVTYPSGFSTTVQRDGLRRLTSLSDSGGSLPTTFSYIGSERPAQINYGNGTQTNFTWDGFQRLQSIGHNQPGANPFYQMDFLYQDDGKKVYERNLLQNGIGDVYQYLPDGRLGTVVYGVPNPLAEVQVPGSQPFVSKTAYTFDSVGNRGTVTVTPGGGGAPVVTAYQTNSVNQYTAVGGLARTYDQMGNLVTTATSTYAYDYAGHLVQATVQGVLNTYQYDAIGRRNLKTTQAGTTSFVYSGDEVVETNGAGGGLTSRLGYFGSPDGRLFYEAQDFADVNGNGNTVEWIRLYYQTDVRGSPTHLTDATGAPVESYTYDIYGAATIKDRLGQVVTASPTNNSFLYTGREWDAESGLYHYRARAYDATTGSFLQQDPIGYLAGPHLYQYVGADPANFVDPYGHNGTPDGKGGPDNPMPGPGGGSGNKGRGVATEYEDGEHTAMTPEEYDEYQRNGYGGALANPEYRPGGLENTSEPDCGGWDDVPGGDDGPVFGSSGEWDAHQAWLRGGGYAAASARLSEGTDQLTGYAILSMGAVVGGAAAAGAAAPALIAAGQSAVVEFGLGYAGVGGAGTAGAIGAGAGVLAGARGLGSNGSGSAGNASTPGPQVGQPVYRVWGGESGPKGEYWTPQNPATMDNFRSQLGLPSNNTGQFLSTGYLNSTSGVTMGRASGIGQNVGGAIQYQMTNGASQVSGGTVHANWSR